MADDLIATPERRSYSTARNRLTALQVQRLAEPGLHHDGAGLYLQISATGTKSWVYRYRLHGKLRDMGLGSYADFTLAEARERARTQRQLVADKIDPIEHRRTRTQEAKAAQALTKTFEDCAREYHEQEQRHWKNVKHRAQWINTLRDYAFPKYGRREIRTIGKSEVLEMLKPLWKSKPETASRVKQRIKTVLEWAAASDLYPDYKHGMWAEVDKVLGKRRVEGATKHHLAAPYSEVAGVIQRVRNSASQEIVKLAFEFTVLTAARSGETRGAEWSEVKWDDRLWVIPASRMKAKKEHRVPLTARCIEILKAAHALTGKADLVFCSPTTKKPFSDAVFTSLLHKGLGLKYTMHGFRSSFRDWGGEKTTNARELLEVSLAHLPGDQTEQAYWRGDMIERRRQLMEEWCSFACPPGAEPTSPAKASGKGSKLRLVA